MSSKEKKESQETLKASPLLDHTKKTQLAATSRPLDYAPTLPSRSLSTVPKSSANGETEKPTPLEEYMKTLKDLRQLDLTKKEQPTANAKPNKPDEHALRMQPRSLLTAPKSEGRRLTRSDIQKLKLPDVLPEEDSDSKSARYTLLLWEPLSPPVSPTSPRLGSPEAVL